MNDLRQLVHEAAAFAGAEPPGMLRGDAPVPDRALLADDSGKSFYLIGLIGGKEVGKSSLVNALVGQPITMHSSHGRGTDAVIAYAHSSQADALRRLLENEAPKRHQIITHDLPHLARQVLLDLPDIDSVYSDHLELTRRMLRHMLFPVWVQSIEKYADQQPQALLAAVAEGNDPGNFLFCLNKADQLPPADQAAAGELREDFAARIARTLRLARPPRVYLTSAAGPDGFELPELRQRLSREKSSSDVRGSREAAARQQVRVLLGWLEDLRLPQKMQRLEDLEEQAGELVQQRIGVPLLEQALPALADHPANRLGLADEVLAARVARWPLVNVVHVLLWPITSLWRRNVLPADAAVAPEALVESHLNAGRPLGQRIAATFAQLEQSHADMAELYCDQPLWKPMAADLAAADLRGRLIETLLHQRFAARARLIRRPGIVGDFVRGVLTLGAVIWFPLLQPIVAAMMQGQVVALGLLLVQLLSVSHLLENAVFLLLYFAFIWMVLRWDSHRRVQYLLGAGGLHPRRAVLFAAKASTPAGGVPDGSDVQGLPGQAVEWMERLLNPIHRRRSELAGLLERMRRIRKTLGTARMETAA